MSGSFSDLGLIVYAQIGLVCFLASILSGLSAMGGGMLIAIVIAPIVGVEAVIPVMTVTMLINNASRAVIYLKSLDLKIASILAATALPAVVLGSIFYVSIDASAVSLLLGIFLLLSVFLRRLGKGRRMTVSPAFVAVAGVPFGFLSGTALGAGLLMVPILLGVGLAGPALLATDAAVAVAIHLVKIAVFNRFEVLDLQLAVAGIIMGLCTVPGTYIASKILARTSLRVHTIFMEIIVVCGGLSFVYNAIKTMGS